MSTDLPTSYLHRQLAQVLTSGDDASRLQIIVAPTSGAALSLRTAAARMDVPLVNVEAVTVNGLALHVWRSMRPFEAGRLVSRDRMASVLASHSRMLPRVEREHFLSSIPQVIASIESDRVAGRDAGWAAESARTSSQRAYASLFAEYERDLAESHLLDMADILGEAVSLSPRFCQERDLGGLIVAGETLILPQQIPLFAELGDAAQVRALLGQADLVDDLEGPFAARVLAGWSFAAPDSGDDASAPRIVESATRREEVWSVLGKIVDRRLSFDSVEIVVSSRETYAPLIEAACSRLGIPTTQDSRLHHDERAFVLAVLDFLRWIASGYQAQHLIDLIRNPAFQEGEASLPPHRIADLLEIFRLTPAMLSRSDLDEIMEEGARRERIRYGEAIQLVTWLRSFREVVPRAEIRPQDLAQSIERLASFYLRTAFERTESKAWLERLSESMDPIPQTLESHWLAGYLVSKIEKKRPSQDFGNGVHVTHWDEAGYGPRQHAFVLGLDDQAAGSISTDDPSHVAGLQNALPDGYGRAIPVRRRMRELMARFGSRLTVSVPAWDVRASRGLFPVSALVEISTMEGIKPARRFNRLDRADQSRIAPTYYRGSFNNVENGLKARQARASEHWTAFDGKTQATAERPNVRFSPSRLEQFISCPYRYFLGSVLGIAGPGEDEGEWLDRAAEGNILHDLFEDHTRKRSRNEAGTTREDESRMLDELRRSLDRQAARTGAAPDAFLEARYRDLSHGIERYFERERNLEADRTPLFAEFAFSDNERADAPPAEYSGVEGRLMLTGRVDRIDETREGNWIVVDYKTGKPEAFVPEKLLKMDDKLQWALYTWAIAQVSGKSVEAAEYVFTSKIGAGWSSRVASPATEQVAPLFESVLRRLRSGHFIPAPDEQKTCTWCDFKSVCGDLRERQSAIKNKFASADPDETQAYEGWAMRDKNVPGS